MKKFLLFAGTLGLGVLAGCSMQHFINNKTVVPEPVDHISCESKIDELTNTITALELDKEELNNYINSLFPAEEVYHTVNLPEEFKDLTSISCAVLGRKVIFSSQSSSFVGCWVYDLDTCLTTKIYHLGYSWGRLIQLSETKYLIGSGSSSGFIVYDSILDTFERFEYFTRSGSVIGNLQINENQRILSQSSEVVLFDMLTGEFSKIYEHPVNSSSGTLNSSVRISSTKHLLCSSYNFVLLYDEVSFEVVRYDTTFAIKSMKKVSDEIVALFGRGIGYFNISTEEITDIVAYSYDVSNITYINDDLAMFTCTGLKLLNFKDFSVTELLTFGSYGLVVDKVAESQYLISFNTTSSNHRGFWLFNSETLAFDSLATDVSMHKDLDKINDTMYFVKFEGNSYYYVLDIENKTLTKSLSASASYFAISETEYIFYGFNFQGITKLDISDLSKTTLFGSNYFDICEETEEGYYFKCSDKSKNNLVVFIDKADLSASLVGLDIKI